MSSAPPVLQPRQMEYSLLQVRLPGRSPENAGVVLYDPERNKIRIKLRQDWDSFGEDEAEVLGFLEDQLEDEAEKRGGAEFLELIESWLSNQVVLTDREKTFAVDPDARLRRLYRENVSEAGAVPLVRLKAAAGGLSDEAPVPEERPDGMFVAQVVGRSMEPLIPDGSLCLFRPHRGGSRNGQKLLIEKFGTTDATAQFTVKIYRGEKVFHEDGTWEHGKIRMIPLNPEFAEWQLSPDEFRVVGEFVSVLPPEE